MTLPKILVVEDEAITSLELTRMLKRWGFEVVGDVVSGQEALDMAINLKPDLIIMDIHLKGNMSGVDAAKEIS
ncbi:MAG: response regulator, partial [Methanobacteriaceae archaeon]|nr:response regulator [Methanobacteriaceae archaeon]